LERHDACSDVKKWFLAQGITDPVDGLINLIENDKIGLANWLIVRVMTRRQCLSYAIFSAEQVIHIFEAENPKDLLPRQAIEAAKAVLANDTVATRRAAYAAAYSSADATATAAAYTSAAATAAAAAYSSAYTSAAATATAAAYSSAYTSAAATATAAAAYTDYYASADYAAAYAADAAAAYAYANAADASVAADYAAAYHLVAYSDAKANAAAADAKKQMHLKILNYGVSLLEEEP